MADWLAPTAVQQFTDNNGNLLSGGKLFTYAAGTTTKLATYTDSTGVTANTNPIILNSRGECQVWIPAGTGYKFVLSPSTDTDPPTNAFWTVDQIFVEPALPTPSSGNELYIARVNAAGTAYEVISPAALLAAIGAAPASGGNYAPILTYGGVLNANTNLTAGQTGTTFDVGAGSTAPFTILLPSPSANLKFSFNGSGGSYDAYINAASGSIILPDGTSATLPFDLKMQQTGFCCDFYADGTNWTMRSSSGQDIVRTPYAPNHAMRSSSSFGGITTQGTAPSINNVTGSHALGTTYTNNTGKPIWVSVIGAASNITLYASLQGQVNGATVSYAETTPQGTYATVSMIVPAGATYGVIGNNMGLYAWNEF